jgi:curli biogenesis system outer membrane secretion channel CsgG
MSIAGCATVTKPQIEKVPTRQPVVSKAIEVQKNSPYQGLKRKVAIGRFTNETKYGQSFFLDNNNDPVGKQAVDILSATLMATDKFILLERADLDKISKELNIGDESPLKNMADYLIVGSVTEFGRRESGKVGVFSRTKEQLAFAKVHVRLLDVRTGQIIYAEEGEGEASSEAGTVFGVGSRAGYDSTINDKALEAAIVKLSSNIIENLMDKPWRSFIIARDNDMYIIGGGASQGIKPGDLFSVIQNGKTVVNPQTNMPITLPGKQIATLRVVSCAGDSPQSEVSYCEVAHGAVTETADLSHLTIIEHR